MTVLRSGFAGSAANDNLGAARDTSRRPRPGGFGASHAARKFAGSRTLRVAMRLILLASFSAFVLLAVSGAFLIGLASSDCWLPASPVSICSADTCLGLPCRRHGRLTDA